MFRSWVILGLLWVRLASADDIGLALTGDAWRWWKGAAEPSSPPEAWRQAGFNDSAWSVGRAGFSWYYTGYEATAFPEDPVDSRSVYLRREFVVEAPSSVQWLTLRIDYDDGFVAFLNGG